jgi:hypothetical protein
MPKKATKATPDFNESVKGISNPEEHEDDKTSPESALSQFAYEQVKVVGDSKVSQPREVKNVLPTKKLQVVRITNKRDGKIIPTKEE